MEALIQSTMNPPEALNSKQHDSSSRDEQQRTHSMACLCVTATHSAGCSPQEDTGDGFKKCFQMEDGSVQSTVLHWGDMLNST